MNQAFFITATGTDIGKTYISAVLLRHLTGLGWATKPIKPLMSGFSPEQLEESDAGQLLNACGLPATPENVAKICTYSFSEAVAPNLAARRAGVEIDYDHLVSFCWDAISSSKTAATPSLCLIEGAGGVLSPATDQKTQADLIIDLALPVILVTANYLGSISHTLTALESMDKRGIKIAAIAVSQPQPNSPEPFEFIDEIERWHPTTYVSVPYVRDPINAGTDLGAKLVKALNL